jgi:hypothetical protein
MRQEEAATSLQCVLDVLFLGVIVYLLAVVYAWLLLRSCLLSRHIPLTWPDPGSPG